MAGELADENAELRAEVAALRAELDTCRQLVAQVIDAEDQGRRRIAQLIHDDSLQTLLAANQELIEAAPGRAQVQRAHEVVAATIARLREAMMALHPVTLEQSARRSEPRTSCCSRSPASCSPTRPSTRAPSRSRSPCAGSAASSSSR